MGDLTAGHAPFWNDTHFPELRHDSTCVCPLVNPASRKMTAPLLSELMENALLAKLRDVDRERLAPHMMRADLRAQDVLQRAGDDVVHTWFPCASAAAAFEVWIDHTNPSVEVAIVGSEGAVGGIVSNGNVPAFATCRVQRRLHLLRSWSLRQTRGGSELPSGEGLGDRFARIPHGGDCGILLGSSVAT